MSKILDFFKSFWTNAKADPVSTAKGIVSLAAAGATCYGMATGTVPVNDLSIGAAAALTTNGLHAIGTDTTTGKTDPTIAAAEKAVNAAAVIAPQALTISDHYEAIRKETGKAQAVLAAVNEGVALLQTVSTPAATTTENSQQ